jgi:cell division protein FtsN
MPKKNKRKEPEFKKPFIVLSRNKIAGWLLLIFFLCAWMFILGVLVGRGTAPLKFDIAEIEDASEVSQPVDGDDPAKEPEQKESLAIKDKTTLEFYEALKENKVDTELPQLQAPEGDKDQIKTPSAKTVAPPATKDAVPEPASPKADTEKAVPEKSQPAASPQNQKATPQKAPAVSRTNAAGPVYTIQAASVKDPKDADQLVRKLKEGGYPAYRVIGKVPGKGIWFRVRIGEYKGKAEAMRVMDKLKKEGIEPILVMK